MRFLPVSIAACNKTVLLRQTRENAIPDFGPQPEDKRFQPARLVFTLLWVLLILNFGARSLSAQAVTVTNVYQQHYAYQYPIGNQDCPSGYNIPDGQYSSSDHLERGHAIHHSDPKNAANDYWVYWAHFDNSSYGYGEVAIFKSTTECGPYILQTGLYPAYNVDGSGYGFQPGGWQSRDDTIFEDNDQTYNADGTVNAYASAYLYTASDSQNSVTSSSGSTCSYANDSMAIFKMTPDYLGIDATTSPSTNGANWAFVCDQREAPVVFKKNNEYFLITSQAAGWYPSQGGYGASSHPLTGWTPDPLPLGNPSTFGGQSSGGFTIYGTSDNTYVLTFDHLGGADSKNPASSEEYDTGELWLPVILDDVAGTATLNWYPSWTVDNTTGVLTLPTLTNLAPSGTATATIASQTAYPISNANDGNYQTMWQGLNSGNAAFAPLTTATSTLCPVTGATETTTCYPSLVVDLGAVYPVQEIDLSQYYVKGSESYYTYKIAYSSDDVNWSTLDYTTFNSASNAKTQNISSVPFTDNITYGFNFLPVNFSARYVALEEVSSILQNQGSNSYYSSGSYTWYSPGLYEIGIIESTAPASPQPVNVVVTASPNSTTSQSTPITADVTVSGPSGSATPTGYVQLSAPGYVSEIYGLVNGSTSFTIPGNSLPNGTVALTASYRADPTSAPVYGIGATTGSSNITEPPFSLSATAANVTTGSTGTSTVTEYIGGGFNSPVTLAVSGLPPGVTAAFNPAWIIGAGNSTLTFTAASTTPAGTSTITVTGTPASGAAVTTTLTLTVSAPVSYTQLINGNSGLCLSGVASEGGQLVQVACSSSTLLNWQISPKGSGYYITNENNGWVVDVGGWSKSSGGTIDGWAGGTSGSANQEWIFTSNGSGSYTVKNVNSGLYLDVSGASTASGAGIVQNAYTGAADQLWEFILPPASLTITPTAATATYGGTAALAASATFSAGTPPTGALVFQVNGGSQIPGTCSISGTTQTCTATYSLGNLAVGSYSVYVSYAGDANYAASFQSTTLTVNKATPTLNWASPQPALINTALDSTQLDATATWVVGGVTRDVAGNYTYTPSAGTILTTAGNMALNVSFTPINTADYNSTTASVTLNVLPQISVPIVWSTPAPITYGTPLSATQLNATAVYNGNTIPGAFLYVPPVGTVLTAGQQILQVQFSPNNTTQYTTSTGNVTLTVKQVTPTVAWAKPDAITYGTRLSSTQLNATASVPGRFTYTPARGTLLAVGTQTLSVTFTPTDSVDYASVTASTKLTVKDATPTLVFAPIPAKTYGNAAFTVKATSASSGEVTYTVTSGPATISGSTVTLTGAGTVHLRASQAASGDYKADTASVTIDVAKATSSITLTNSAASIKKGAPEAFTATLSGVSGGVVPPGRVSFYNGATLLRTVSIKAGVAYYSTEKLPAGTDQITAVYDGNFDYLPATSKAVTVTVK
jgi:hypothetical protein